MKVLVDYSTHCSTTRSSFSFDLTSCLVSLQCILLAEYKILYGINVASQAADDHVPCILQRTLIPYKILYWARRMPRKLTEQLVRLKEAADVARYSAYVTGRLHIPAWQCTCTPCTGHHRAATTWNPRLHWTRPDVWPANSPDLNPVDYRIWGLIQERVYQTAIQDTDDLKQCLTCVWLSWSKASLIKPLNSGGQGWELAFAQRDNTLNSC